MSRSQNDLWDLNQKLENLRQVLQRNGRDASLSSLNQRDQDELRSSVDLMDFFLWKVCQHETAQPQLSAAAVTRTRHDLLDRFEQEERGPFLQGIAAFVARALLPRNVWLYLRARQNVRELEADQGTLLSSLLDARLKPLDGVDRNPDASWARATAEDCSLRNRRPHQIADGKRHAWEVRELRSAVYCRRACDLHLLLALCFRYREMARAFDLSITTVHDLLVRCDGRKPESVLSPPAPTARR